MVRLEKSKALQRKIRQDDVKEMAKPTWDLVRDAIKSGKVNEALEFISYGCTENKAMHDSAVSFAEMALTQLARFGEEELDKLFRDRYGPQVQAWISTTPGVMESLYRCVEYQRGHFGEFTVTEEPDRYVAKYDPCGSGGRLRRTRGVGTTKKAYPWSWSKAGVPYYCTHCCLMMEIIPIELRGYPIRINIPGDKPEDPCIHLFYKKPELIPEEYFTRVGKTKTIK